MSPALRPSAVSIAVASAGPACRRCSMSTSRRYRSRVRVGVVFPQLEIGTDPARIRHYVEAVEGLGSGHLVAFDHVLGATRHRPGGDRFSYDHRSLFHEPLVLFARLVPSTKLELG